MDDNDENDENDDNGDKLTMMIAMMTITAMATLITIVTTIMTNADSQTMMILTLYVSWMMVRRLPLLSLVPAVGRVEGRVRREGRRGQARAAVRADGGTARLPTAGTETLSKIIIWTK